MSDATKPRLKVSREGIVLIKSFEGFRPRAVQGEDGRWTIGYGHTASAREGATVGEQDAELLLQYDLMPVVKALNDQVAASLNQHQFDALASFAVSIGLDRFLASDVVQRLNDGHAGQAADALIGWPESATPESALRRRAAERALFVADPAAPILLADLLAAPLPPPPVETTPGPIVRPDFSQGSTDARAAAVAALLGEPAPREPSWEPEPPAFIPPTFDPATAVTHINLRRYSPYAHALIGPLPGFPSARQVEEAGKVVPEAATPEEAVEPTSVEEPAESPPPAEDAPSDPAPPAETIEAVEPEPEVVPLVPPAPSPSPFAALDQQLVLTPATEADFIEAERPAWPAEQRDAAPSDETVLFEDEPALSVLRHEVEPEEPRRFDWSETGAFLIMGGVGLAACGASAAAFRLASSQPSPMGETTVIAWALAVIGVICVGVSSWNLYVRWSRTV